MEQNSTTDSIIDVPAPDNIDAAIDSLNADLGVTGPDWETLNS